MASILLLKQYTSSSLALLVSVVSSSLVVVTTFGLLLEILKSCLAKSKNKEKRLRFSSTETAGSESTITRPKILTGTGTR